jgi:hypothetical protein
MQANLSQQFGSVLNAYVIDRAIHSNSNSSNSSSSSKAEANSSSSSSTAQLLVIDSDEADVDDSETTETAETNTSGVNELTMLLLSAHTSKAKAVELYAAKDYRGAYEGQ